jgi:uncharacterized protein
MAYGLSWLGWLPYVLSQSGLGLLPFHLSQLVGLPGAFLGPCLSGFLMTAVTEGKTGVRHLLRRLVLWRVGWQWYLFALVGIPVIRTLGALILPGVLATYRPSATGSALLLYLSLLPLTFLTSGLAEEPGWRGFALPRLQQRHGPLLGSLILGALWAGWHLPLFFTSWAPASWAAGNGLLTLFEFAVIAIALALVITWVFNHTQASLLIAMLIHGAVDAFSPAFLFSHPLAGTLVQGVIGVGGVALVLIVVTRGRLGYQQVHSLPDLGPGLAGEKTVTR